MRGREATLVIAAIVLLALALRGESNGPNTRGESFL